MFDGAGMAEIWRRVDAQRRQVDGRRPVECDRGEPLPLHERIEHRLVPVEHEPRHAVARNHPHGKIGQRRFGLHDALRFRQPVRFLGLLLGLFLGRDPLQHLCRQRRRIARPVRRQQVHIDRVFRPLDVEPEIRGKREPERAAVAILPRHRHVAWHCLQEAFRLDTGRPVEVEHQHARVDRGVDLGHSTWVTESHAAVAVGLAQRDTDGLRRSGRKRQREKHQQQRRHPKEEMTWRSGPAGSPDIWVESVHARYAPEASARITTAFCRVWAQFIGRWVKWDLRRSRFFAD